MAATSGSLGTLTSFLSGSAVTGGFAEASDVGVFGLVGVAVLFLTGLFLVSFSGEAFLGVDSATGFISFLGVDFEGIPLLEDFSSGGLEVFFGSTFAFGAVCFGDSMGLALCLSTVLFRSDLERWTSFFSGLVASALLDTLVSLTDFGGAL